MALVSGGSGLRGGISVVIPNYNGEQLLAENLPSVISALQRWSGESELIVVDDASTDESCRLLRDRFPQARLLINDANSGFSRSCNAGFREARYPIVFCINSDVGVSDTLFTAVVPHFADESVFAVTPAILAEREGRNQGIVYGMYGKGFLKGGFAPIDDRSGCRENFYCIGACVAYDLAKFRALGGYSEIYTPYLFEEVDLSYRAWKRGWRNLYEPGTTVHHYSSATIGKVKRRKKRTIYFRNRFLFHWINLSDPGFILSNLLHTFFRLAVSFLWLDIAYYAAFCGALSKLPEVFAGRSREKRAWVLGDAAVLKRTS